MDRALIRATSEKAQKRRGKGKKKKKNKERKKEETREIVKN